MLSATISRAAGCAIRPHRAASLHDAAATDDVVAASI
jgi:hypothetical protein